MTTTAPARAVPSSGTGGAGRSAALESLAARLDDPRTASALHDLLDHAELLALVVTMGEGLLQRSETLTGNLAEGLAELRVAAGAATAAATGTGGLAVGAADLRALLLSLRTALPALQALLAGSLLQPATVRGLEAVAGAVTEGLAQAPTVASGASGLRGVLSELRAPGTLRGLGTLLSIARSLGRRSVA